MYVKCLTFGRLSEMLVVIKIAQNTCKMLKGHHKKGPEHQGDERGNSPRGGVRLNSCYENHLEVLK